MLCPGVPIAAAAAAACCRCCCWASSAAWFRCAICICRAMSPRPGPTMFRSPMTVAPQLTVMLMLGYRFIPRTCVLDVRSGGAVASDGGLGGVSGRVASSSSSQLSTLVMRFAIRTLSICAIEMMLPCPLICVAALITISGVWSPSCSRSYSSSSCIYGLVAVDVDISESTTM